MTTQTLELQAVTDEELQAAAGGRGSHSVSVAHKPFIGALQNLQVNDQADRDGYGSTKLQSLRTVATIG